MKAKDWAREISPSLAIDLIKASQIQGHFSVEDMAKIDMKNDIVGIATEDIKKGQMALFDLRTGEMTKKK